MTATRTSAVVAAVVATLTAALPDDVKVIDGQPKQRLPKDLVVVGFSAGRVAVEVRQSRSDLNRGRAETMSIVCLASSWRGGSTPMQTVRDRALEILDLVQAALAANRTLGNVVTRAELALDMMLDQAQTKDGPTATVEFSIDATLL